MGPGPLVVGVDGSEGSAETLRWAMGTARRLGLPVVPVFGYSPWAATFFSVPPFDADSMRNLFKEQFESEWCAPLAASGLEYDPHFIGADAATALLEVAKVEGAGLIALGAHGHSRWSAHLLGSVTAKVLHHSHCPVVVVPHPVVAAAPSGRMVAGVDGSPGSRRALWWAAGHAAALGLSLQAVCVTPALQWNERPAFFTLEGEVVADIEAGLAGVAREASAEAGIPVDTQVVVGDPTQTLLGWAEGWDLLVLGSRGHSSVGEVVFGSVGRACATHAARPVVIVPATEG
jgi:nucleotide-binding universal stress UspA family protein